VCDTRAGATNQCNNSGAGAPIGAVTPLTFNVSDGSSIPTSGVSAVVFNLTAINPTVRTVLTAYAAGTAKPTASNVNLEAGAVVPNRVIVPVTCSAGACDVTISNSAGSVNVAIDIDGWFAAGSGAEFSALSPARVCDTRVGNPGNFCREGVVPAGGVLNIKVAGFYGVPGSPVAVVVNVTAVEATTGTYVTVYPGPSSATAPKASDLNVVPGQVATNLVVVKVDPTTGTINLFNAAGNVELIVDLFGYYS
jgi:hypothetical protein